MVQIKKKLGKTEFSLIKEYCSRITDEDLQSLSAVLPQQIAGDRAFACSILQKDKEVDRWLSQANSADDWFNKIDSIGEIALVELESRNSKKE